MPSARTEGCAAGALYAAEAARGAAGAVAARAGAPPIDIRAAPRPAVPTVSAGGGVPMVICARRRMARAGWYRERMRPPAAAQRVCGKGAARGMCGRPRFYAHLSGDHAGQGPARVARRNQDQTTRVVRVLCELEVQLLRTAASRRARPTRSAIAHGAAARSPAHRVACARPYLGLALREQCLSEELRHARRRVDTGAHGGRGGCEGSWALGGLLSLAVDLSTSPGLVERRVRTLTGERTSSWLPRYRPAVVTVHAKPAHTMS